MPRNRLPCTLWQRLLMFVLLSCSNAKHAYATQGMIYGNGLEQDKTAGSLTLVRNDFYASLCPNGQGTCVCKVYNASSWHTRRFTIHIVLLDKQQATQQTLQSKPFTIDPKSTLSPSFDFKVPPTIATQVAAIDGNITLYHPPTYPHPWYHQALATPYPYIICFVLLLATLIALNQPSPKDPSPHTQTQHHANNRLT